jgi:hypothetical protein
MALYVAWTGTGSDEWTITRQVMATGWYTILQSDGSVSGHKDAGTGGRFIDDPIKNGEDDIDRTVYTHGGNYIFFIDAPGFPYYEETPSGFNRVVDVDLRFEYRFTAVHRSGVRCSSTLSLHLIVENQKRRWE